MNRMPAFFVPWHLCLFKIFPLPKREAFITNFSPK